MLINSSCFQGGKLMAQVAKPGRISDSADVSAQELQRSQLYENIEAQADFKELERSKRNFVVPATIFFLVFYLALPILDGFARDFMNTKIIGDLNLAYLFALAQFVMVGVITWLYMRVASQKFDKLIERIRASINAKGGK